ncbi:hypothetical protein GCM10007049_18530 [Echinicola pacifica]|uniref:Uncharacterized protein n=1 Tax=Echinicola pacifica TaxID=346377 RepID=A0A918UQE5_9BACT|nr:hypothetical protein [Echinicola pacifica]GGZ26205.1 hypothetical protein GCM10007049_18530 [Echinicola pacifica]
MTAIASNYKVSQNETIFSFQSVIRNNNKEVNELNVREYLASRSDVELEGQGTFSFGNYAGVNKEFNAVYFNLKGNLSEHYAFFRGLVLAGQPNELFLESVHETKSFTLKFYNKNEAVAKKYLEKLFKIVEDELRFKQVLRKVLVNQERHKLEEKLLFNELSN